MKIDKEFKALIPALTQDEYEQLGKNLVADGIREPLVLWNDTLIDGHNRYDIALEHGLSYKTVQKEFDSREEVIQWIILNQFGRRNLPNYERAKLALRLEPIIEEKAKENKIEIGKLTGRGNELEKVSQISDKPLVSINTNKELAKVAGVSHDTIHKVRKIEEKAPEEVKEKLSKGEISINQAYQQIKKAEKIEQVEKHIEEYKEVQTGIIDIYNTNKRYNIIYADPAWSYWEGGQKNQSLHYLTMTMGEIKNLPVKNIADDNCILFLWVTYPILKQAFDVIESWGFNYSTCGFCWVKKNKNGEGNFFGLGSWTRANTELCLIATKGSITRLDASISQIIESPIEEHSKKPTITRDLITKLVGELPRIELFSRNKTNGWDVWGNEV